MRYRKKNPNLGCMGSLCGQSEPNIIEKFSSRWLGKMGIVSIADAVSEEQPIVLVSVVGDQKEAQRVLPAAIRNEAGQILPVIVCSSKPLRPY